ncbi:MAG: uroporphyrinogen decarboxylase [Elusimicrobiota bacterium]
MVTLSSTDALKDLRVASLESRKESELREKIKALKGESFIVPGVRQVKLLSAPENIQFFERLKNKEFHLLVFLTPSGARIFGEMFNGDLSSISVVSRGPKTTDELTHSGLSVSHPVLNTWRDILKYIDGAIDIKNKKVAVVESGDANRLFAAELDARGAEVISVSFYKAALPEDVVPIKNLIHDVIYQKIDIFLFTTGTQVENLFSVARQEGKAQELKHALKNIVVGSIGPSCSNVIRRFGVSADIESSDLSLEGLLHHVAQNAQTLLKEKKENPFLSIQLEISKNKIQDELYNSLFLKACRREKTERTPLWLMRQAGRYMKEYRELRAKVSFMDLCKNSDLAAEVTVDAAHRLGVDAAIIFSDLLLLVEPLGFELSYGKDQGPVIANPFRDESHLKTIKPVQVDESMGYVFEAISKTRKALKGNIPLIGFAGAPFTMASYIVEGKGSRNFVETKKLMNNKTNLWNTLLKSITDSTLDYVNGQIDAGAQVIQIFDSWVGCLSPEDFRSYVFPETKRLISGIKPGVPVIYFGTQTNGLLPIIKELKSEVVGVDWRIELDEAWDLLGNVAIQGNLDPVHLFSRPEVIKIQAKRILNQAAGRPGHIFNIGHGILPETPIENVHTLIHFVKEFKN